MTKFCVNCGESHERRGYFCKPDCHREYRAKKRNERADKHCRLCGRPIRKKRELTPVRSEHTESQESQPCQM